MPNYAGGPIAAGVTSLAFDDDTGVLYISSLGALNVRFLNGTIVRVDGYDGLPYPNVTSLAVQHRPATTWTTARTILHIGTQAGLSSADITPATTAMRMNRTNAARVRMVIPCTTYNGTTHPPDSAINRKFGVPIDTWTNATEPFANNTRRRGGCRGWVRL